jgi:alpha-L-arabinofuranosidase
MNLGEYLMKRILIVNPLAALSALIFTSAALAATEYHVSVRGNDAGDGSQSRMLRTISAAARLAQPGDLVTVHEGVYRERVNPPRGGQSDAKRIVYRVAAGEKVLIKGSEAVKNWVRVQNDTWKVTLPNTFFGDFNPYSDRIHGDWFDPRGRVHHTGAVYLNGDWLIEATKLEEVLLPAGNSPAWLARGGQYLLNVAWLRPGKGAGNAGRIPASGFAAKKGTQNAPCSEGGDCIGFIEHGHWVRYDRVDFGQRNEAMEIRAASASEGGIIEIRLDAPNGDLLGKCSIPNTGDWQSWTSFHARIKPVSGVKTICLVFCSNEPQAASTPLWFSQVAKDSTTIWAQFPGIDPNHQKVEINVRRTVFYPDKPGRNYITVRGFTLEHAATPWAPPTAEQMGLIGTHWSKGWIIEDNVIRYSKCSGVALGKYGDAWDNRAESAEGYVGTLTRALEHGWNKATVGSHIVRNNHISHCEQTGVVGSLGCSFSKVTGNEIHDIHVHRLFSGAEMAGIKFHGAIDVEISHNHIHHTTLGVWLDWMAQGAHLTGNLLHDNQQFDLFFEVDHGPYLVDNNILLSPTAQLVVSQGGAYAHNLIAGNLQMVPFDGRMTPLHKAHSTELAGLHNNPCGDVRYYHNLFVDRGDLRPYDRATLPVWMAGNVFLKDAKPCKQEPAPLVRAKTDPQCKLIKRSDGWHLTMILGKGWAGQSARKLVTTELLGKAAVPNLPYEKADGASVRIDTDYFGRKRDDGNPCPGPFEIPAGGDLHIKVWPVGMH